MNKIIVFSLIMPWRSRLGLRKPAAAFAVAALLPGTDRVEINRSNANQIGKQSQSQTRLELAFGSKRRREET